MEQLRGLTKQNTEYLKNLHDDLLAVCVTLLERDRYFIMEEALIRAGKRLSRADVQWPVIRLWLEERLGCKLTAHGRAKLREKTKRQFDPLKVIRDVAKALEGGNGNQTAGYSFADWDRDATQRQISNRHHVADGFEGSAELLEAALQRPPPPLPRG
jgi:hypothetical protein